MHENRWSLRGRALTVTPPPGGGQRQAVAIPPELQGATTAPPALAVDDNGFVWVCAPGSRHLFRLNPRGPGHNGGVQRRGGGRGGAGSHPAAPPAGHCAE